MQIRPLLCFLIINYCTCPTILVSSYWPLTAAGCLLYVAGLKNFHPPPKKAFCVKLQWHAIDFSYARGNRRSRLVKKALLADITQVITGTNLFRRRSTALSWRIRCFLLINLFWCKCGYRCLWCACALRVWLTLSVHCPEVTLVNHGCLLAHACGRGQIELSSECVTPAGLTWRGGSTWWHLSFLVGCCHVTGKRAGTLSDWIREKIGGNKANFFFFFTVRRKNKSVQLR